MHGYDATLRSLLEGPRPRQDIDPAIARTMERRGHAVLIRQKSPYPGHAGRSIDHLALSQDGYKAATATVPDGGVPPPGLLQPGRVLPNFAGIGTIKPPHIGGTGTAGFAAGVVVGAIISAG